MSYEENGCCTSNTSPAYKHKNNILTLIPFDAMGICLNKQKLMYKVLVPSIIIPTCIYILMDLWSLWTHLHVGGWLSVKLLHIIWKQDICKAQQ